ncbi:MAG: hypothetical protein PHR94_08580 [Methylomonas lenta]|jgi:hypothetical protein|nr:hypothetical protein [Methylomonas lenta]
MTLVSLRQLLDFTPAPSFVVSTFNGSKMEQVQAIKQSSAIMHRHHARPHNLCPQAITFGKMAQHYQ